MSNEIERFAEAVVRYCRWAEREPQDATSEARTARRLVAELCLLAVQLPYGSPEVNAPELPLEEWKTISKRFEILPFRYYFECFNPLAVPAEKPIRADLADDLADIWRDLKEGLILYEGGAVEAAAFQWRLHFSCHWGHHATAALYALQTWFSQNDDDLEQSDSEAS